MHNETCCLQNFNGNFEAWRWVLMVGVLVPINHTGNLMVKMLVWAVEYIFVFQKKAMYYLVGTKVGHQYTHVVFVASRWCNFALLTSRTKLQRWSCDLPQHAALCLQMRVSASAYANGATKPVCSVVASLALQPCVWLTLTWLAAVLQKYLSRLFKGALVCGLFAAIFSGQSNNNPTVHKIYIIIIKVSPAAPPRQPHLSRLLLLLLKDPSWQHHHSADQIVL